MNLIKLAIARPTAVIAGVLMALMFGVVALQTIPIHLAPDVQRPIIRVSTSWSGAAPVEIESEIVTRQEEALRGLKGSKSMTSTSRTGRASVILEFGVSQDMDKALLLVANRLDRVTGYPDEADEPTLHTSGTEDNSIAWFRLQRTEGNNRELHTYRDYAEDVIQERLERVSGVSSVNVWGGGRREMRIIVDPAKMARFSLTVSEIVDALRAANASISGGDVEEGKRRYVVRTDGKFTTPEQVAAVVLRAEGDDANGGVSRVSVADIADVRFDYKKPTALLRANGEATMGMSATAEAGANVIEVMKGIREATTELNTQILPPQRLHLEQIYDDTVYINSSINLVIQNIWVGGTLAVIVLLVFLRSVRATLIVALAIPVSVVASFVAMAMLGRSLNVISLAGIAFAVGMVVDAAIVVLENIYRLRERGRPPMAAAYEGTKQVWGAILVSALTTVMVFVPILVMELEVGQLFRDIAVAISVAVMLSLIVSITVIPTLSARLLVNQVKAPGEGIRLPGIDHFGRAFLAGVTGLTRAVAGNKALALGLVAALTVVTGVATWQFLPDLEYLPEGNRNFVAGIVFPPPGYNLSTTTAIANRVESAIKPHWVSVSGPEPKPGEPPRISNFFFVARNSSTFIGAISAQEQRAGELIPVLSRPVFREPGTFAVMFQPSIFGRGVGGARAIDLDISGPDLEEVIGVAKRANVMISGIMPRSEGNQVRPRPGLELGAPEVRLLPDPVRLADNGISARDLGLTVDAFNDGLRVAEITIGGKRVDLILMGPENNVLETQGIANLPVVTRSGDILPVSALAEVVFTAGPVEIRHTERERTITLQVRPAPTLALGAALEMLESEVVQKLRNDGLPTGVKIRLRGTADKLTQTWDVMRLNLLLALVLVYLVMAVLFESFVYPLIIALSVPLATAGGVVGLLVLNQFHFQALDMLTLLGFVILIGIVVNNAILLVHQTLYLIRDEGMEHREAIVEATRNRTRPIFMSTLTSVFGMMPLVVFPGAGSELYRGLGSVVIGGLALSALLTLAIVPPLMSVFVGTLESRRLGAGNSEALTDVAD